MQGTVGKQRAEFTDNKKAEEAKIFAKEEEKEQRKKEKDDKDLTTKAKMDSAAATSTPASTFKIRR